MANTVGGLSPVISPIYSPITTNRNPINFFYKPISYKQSPKLSLHRSQNLNSSLLCHGSDLNSSKVSSFISFSKSRPARVLEVASKQRNRRFSVYGSLANDSLLNPEEEEESDDSAKRQVASVDIKLPRRSLLVEFTCNSCGVRTKRLISRLAYERGLVFVQCGGCLQHHKLVDNLGLITEYDFRETSKDLDTDQV